MNVPMPSDNCGGCVTATVAVTARPYHVEPDGETGVRAYYRCANCGARWWTSRLLSYEEMAEAGRAGAA